MWKSKISDWSFVGQHLSFAHSPIRYLLFAILLFFLPVTVFAAPPKPSTPQLIEAAFERGDISRDTANLYLAYALFDYAALPAEFHSDTPWHATPVLLQLTDSLPAMNSISSKNAISGLLSGTCSGSSVSLPNVITSTHFYVEYDTIGGGLSVSDYLSALETTWNTEVTDFGWAAPPVYPLNPASGGRYHVRIDPTINSNYYGYVAPSGTHAGYVGDNPATIWNDVDAYASCMVLNADYSRFPGTPTTAMQATIAHEFNHSIQFGYGALTGGNRPDNSFIEAGATWMEDEVFDNSNDNYNYLYPNFNVCMGEYDDFPYAYWVVFRALTEPFGTGTPGGGEQVMQNFWELTSKSPDSNQLTALNAGLTAKGTSLANAYFNAAVALKFNRSCSGGYVQPYCMEEGAAYVAAKGKTTAQGVISAVGGSRSGNLPNNFALNWVRLPITDTAYTVLLENTGSSGELRAGIACDTGSALNVSPFPATAHPGETITLPNFSSSACAEAVAVITNQQQTAANPNYCSTTTYTLRVTSARPEPVFAPLPDISLREGSHLPQAIDLWQFVSDDLDTPNVMTYTISNTPAISAGITITGNRYIAVKPIAGGLLSPGWYGSTAVDVTVQDTDGLTDTASFTVTVTHIFKTLLFPVFKNFTFP